MLTVRAAENVYSDKHPVGSTTHASHWKFDGEMSVINKNFKQGKKRREKQEKTKRKKRKKYVYIYTHTRTHANIDVIILSPNVAKVAER